MTAEAMAEILTQPERRRRWTSEQDIRVNRLKLAVYFRQLFLEFLAFAV